MSRPSVGRYFLTACLGCIVGTVVGAFIVAIPIPPAFLALVLMPFIVPSAALMFLLFGVIQAAPLNFVVLPITCRLMRNKRYRPLVLISVGLVGGLASPTLVSNWLPRDTRENAWVMKWLTVGGGGAGLVCALLFLPLARREATQGLPQSN